MLFNFMYNSSDLFQIQHEQAREDAIDVTIATVDVYVFENVLLTKKLDNYWNIFFNRIFLKCMKMLKLKSLRDYITEW